MMARYLGEDVTEETGACVRTVHGEPDREATHGMLSDGHAGFEGL